jgi:hypothetical protein
VAALDIPWLVTVEGSPRLELILRRQESRLVINLINRGAGEMLMPSRIINEELLPESNIRLRVRLASPPSAVTPVPADALQWHYTDGLLQITVPSVLVHTALVIEP